MDVSSLQEQSTKDTDVKPVLQYDDLPDYLTIKELQAYMRCGQNKAYAFANRPDFPKLRDGSKKIFPKAQVREWMERQMELQMQSKGVRTLQKGNARLARSL